MKLEGLTGFLSVSFAGIHLYKIGLAFLVILLALVVRKVFERYVVNLCKRIARKTKSQYDDLLLNALSAPVSALIYITGIYWALILLELPLEPYNIPAFLGNAFRISISLVVVWAIYRLSNLLAIFLKQIISQTDPEMAEQFSPLVTQALRFTVLVLGILLIIQNLGYSVGSLLAGLGIGGLAIALAAQDTLSNLFGTLVMITDKPFKIGDWVQFKDVDGDVESIGFRSTKVRTWSKSLKIVPNKLLTSEIIENWSAMPKRRVKMTIGVTYSTPPDKMAVLRDRMEGILKSDPGVNQEYFLVYFTGFGASALEIFVYYFTKTTVWKEYLEVRQRINLKFMQLVEEMNLEFAFPSQTLYFGDSLSVAGRSVDFGMKQPGNSQTV
ncbi:mechanosensitive ion channel family protein [bacterium]|nr:mechanosensitive ion channel family protein [candidate division CSSED10-310 bacterium]